VTDKMVVLSNPIEGREDDYNRWYDDVHVPDVLTRVRGLRGASRYRAAERQPFSPVVWRFIAIWEIDPEVGLAAETNSVRELRAMKKSGNFDPQDTLYRRNPAMKASASTWFRQVYKVNSAGGSDASDDHLLIAFSNNVLIKGEQFDDWSVQHRQEVLHKVEASKSAELYTAADDQLEEPMYRHMLIYRVAKDEFGKAQDATSWQDVESAHALTAGPSTFTNNPVGWWFIPHSQLSVEQLSAARDIQ